MSGPEAGLAGAVRDLSFARDLPRVTEIVRAVARHLVGADGVTFVLKEDGHCYYADEDSIAPLWKGRRFPLDSCISGWVMTRREPVAITDIYQDDRVPQDAYRATFVKSLLMVPVRAEDPIAAIGAYWASEHQATSDEQRVLETLAQAASLALANVQLWSDLTRALAREQQARAEAEAARQWAEDANRFKDEFVASASHALRTPLNVIQGWLWQIRERPLTPDRLQKGLDTLDRNTAQLIQSVEGLLDVSRRPGS